MDGEEVGVMFGLVIVALILMAAGSCVDRVVFDPYKEGRASYFTELCVKKCEERGQCGVADTQSIYEERWVCGCADPLPAEKPADGGAR